MGDAAREVNGEEEAAASSKPSSMEIRRRVRGRSVETEGAELVWDCDEGVPFERCMACGSRAMLLREEQHRTGQVIGRRRGACHQVTAAYCDQCEAGRISGD